MTPELRALLLAAQNALDMAFCFADDERRARRYAETRDRLKAALAAD